MTKNTTMVGAEQNDLVDSFSSSSFSSPGLSSSESDSSEEVTSPAYSSSSSSSDHQLATDPLLDMSSLFQQLPIKRGLSKHYQGKSQSFTSLANVRSVEDLAKPENPYNKKLKCCRRSYGGGFVGETHRASKCSSSSNTLSRQICKSSRGSCSSLTVRRGSANLDITASRPPMPPHRSTSATTTIPNQTPLFA